MPRILEKYYYSTKAQAEDNLSMARAMGIKATIKKLDSGWVMNVYGGTLPPVTYRRERI